MTRDRSRGVLVFDTDATLQHVDPAAAALLDTSCTALLEGTAPCLQSPVSGPDGASYPSLFAFVAQVLAEDGSVPSVALGDDRRADARVTYGPEGPSGVVVTVRPANDSPAETDSSSNGHSERLRLLDAAVEYTCLPVLITEATPIAPPGPRIVYTNPAFTEVTGYTREEAEGQSPRFLQGPETDPDTLARIRTALEAEEPVRETVLNYAKDGTPFWNDLYVAPVRDAEGEVTHYVSIQDDVTEQRRTERFRVRQSELLERIARGAPLSEVLADLVAFIEEERPGMRGSVLLLDPDTNTLRHGAAPNLPDAYVDAIDGEPIGPAAGSCGTAAHQDAAVIAEDIAHDERWANYRDVALDHGLRACWSTPIHGENDEVLGTFAFYYDGPRAPDERDRALIDEASRLASIAIEHDRQRQELQLQKSQLRRLVENAQPIVFFLDDEGTFLLSEGEDLAAVGLDPGELVGESVYELYSEYPTLLDYIDRALDGKTVDDVIEVEGVTFDIWYAPYYDRSGEVAGCIGMAVDITERREAEAALRASRDLLRRTQKMAHVGGWVYDPEADTMEGTDETYQIYDLPVDAQMTLEQSLSFYPPDTAEALRTAAARCLEHGEPFDEEGPMVSSEGTRRWVRIRGEPRRNEEGAIVKMVGTVQDLTERHAIEERLREQKEWLRSITENASGGIYRSTADGLVYANQALLDLFGYESLEEMSAADPRSFYAHPERRDELLQRESEEGGVDAIEVEYRRKDGSIFTGLLRSTKVDRGDDEPAYYDGVVTDITEQKARERTLRAHREKMNALYETTERLFTADTRTAIADHIHDLLDETFEYPLTGVSFVEKDAIVPERVSRADECDLPPVQALDVDGDSLAVQALRSGEPTVVEDVQETDSDRSYGDLRSVVWVPIAERGIIYLGRVTPGRPDSFDLHLIDILAKKAAAVLERIEHERELKTAKQEAEEASRLKSALLANMSHEIRTPLTSIIGFAGILRENLSDQNARYAELVHRGGERLMNTLDSVLQLSKLEAGVIDPASEPVDLVANVRRTVNLHRSEAEAAGVALHFDAGDTTLPVGWDPTVIQRVLSNLLSNAIKFTPEGGTVTVRVEEAADHVSLMVADTGIGISDAFRARLFDAFTQESEGLEREHEGSGLGLAIVKRLVELMDGRIEVESTKGEGTTFRVVVPRRVPEG